MARKKPEPLPPPERPEITHWRDWMPVAEVEEIDVDPAGEENAEDQVLDAKPKRSKARVAAVSVAAVALLGIGGGGVAFVMNNNQHPTEITNASQQAITVTETPEKPEPEPFCSSPTATSDDAPMLSPEGVIQHLQYAYYVTKDVNVALDTYTADAGVSETALREAIESTPEGTEHCLIIDIVDEEAGLVNVDLQVKDPDESYRTYLQKVTVVPLDNGEYRITSMEARKELTA